jgi:hypothetical protein
MAESNAKKISHRSTRFLPDPEALAQLTIKADKNKSETYTALIYNESKTGCGLVIVSSKKIKIVMVGICRVGTLPYSGFTVKWVKELDRGVWRIGIEYTE